MYGDQPLNHQSGFSLMELLVTMVITVIVLGAVFTQMKSAFQLSSSAYDLSDAQQNLRNAHDVIGRDMVSTGDGLRGMNNIRVRETFVNNFITTAPVTNPSDPGYVILPIVTSDNNVASGTAVSGSNPAATLLMGSDRITFFTIDPTFAAVSLPADAIVTSGSNVSVTAAQLATSNFQIGQIYFISSEYGGTFGMITNVTGGANPNLIFAASDPYDLNQPGTNGPINFVSRGPSNQAVPTTLQRVRIVQYYVITGNLLMRRVIGVNGAVGHIDSVIAEHVTGLQFRYMLDNFSQPLTQLTTPDEQVAVREIEITVSAETAHPMPSGQRKQISSTSLSSVRNLQFRQAL